MVQAHINLISISDSVLPTGKMIIAMRVKFITHEKCCVDLLYMNFLIIFLNWDELIIMMSLELEENGLRVEEKPAV